MWADHSTTKFYIVEEMRYDIVKKIMPPYLMEYLVTAVLENDKKNSALYKNELLKTPQSTAWTSLNVRVQVAYPYKSNRVCGYRHINLINFN